MKFLLCFAILTVVAVYYAHGQSRPTRPKPRLGANLTECQKKRAQAQEKLIVGGLLPECDDKGDYAGLQCHPPNVRGNRFCQCWRKDGTPITRPSTKIKTCSCVRHKEDVKAKKDAGPLLGAFDPECKEDGSYQSKQCSSSSGMCWCVDADGKEKTKPSRATVKC